MKQLLTELVQLVEEEGLLAGTDSDTLNLFNRLKALTSQPDNPNASDWNALGDEALPQERQPLGTVEDAARRLIGYVGWSVSFLIQGKSPGEFCLSNAFGACIRLAKLQSEEKCKDLLTPVAITNGRHAAVMWDVSGKIIEIQTRYIADQTRGAAVRGYLSASWHA